MTKPSLIMRRNENVIVLRRDKKIPVLSQLDLAEIEILKNELADARKRYEEKRRFILEILRSGAIVEPGPFRPRIEVLSRLIVR